ncbi:MAG TPA: multicopper oxidase domain-containing protein [Nitrososphaera sp.]|nr:multicopper oxidase domain-containing protein [Nitrososphaera sp.]
MSDKRFFTVATSALLLAGIVSVLVPSMLKDSTEELNAEGAVVAGGGPAPTGVSRELTLIAEDAELEISPGERVTTWTFNGTVPGPTLRFTEGDNVTIHFINKSPLAHTLHLHGNHDDKSDGVIPQVLPNQNYTYNFIADPAGAFMYHCHAYPTSLHIRMGMYGSLIVDPQDSEKLEPAREFSVVMSEFDPDNQDNFIAKYYPVNGYTDQYMGDDNSLKVKQNELVRFYVVNIGTTIPYSFHLHSTIFKVYQSGLVSNTPIDAQTIEIGPGNTAIVEARWKWPGSYMFHTHGLQEEKGNMGQIQVLSEEEDDDDGTLQGLNGKSLSMIDWQYDLQKELQKPELVAYEGGQGSSAVIPAGHGGDHGQHQIVESGTVVKIPQGAWDKNQNKYYEPATITVEKGASATWVNEDAVMHTVTSVDGSFDSSLIGSGMQWQNTFSTSGVFDYYCTLHPWMKGSLEVK